MSEATCSGVAERMRVAASRATGLLRILANEERLLLLCQLAEGPRCVGELERLLDIRQPTLSQQLGVLRKSGLVDTRREGKSIHYRLASAEARALIEHLYRQFCLEERSSDAY
ncbi:MAG TPA: metalloregulator ArsR/SmtB family transcription factor [Rhodocyclaceae bacterium]|nr:metalloregulator ArsR/SmtB family transcription factor [Rhodocyclaceae bacterium]